MNWFVLWCHSGSGIWLSVCVGYWLPYYPPLLIGCLWLCQTHYIPYFESGIGYFFWGGVDLLLIVGNVLGLAVHVCFPEGLSLSLLVLECWLLVCGLSWKFGNWRR
jgi:hypothetical protein